MNSNGKRLLQTHKWLAIFNNILNWRINNDNYIQCAHAWQIS